MNAALERTIFELAYDKAWDKALEAGNCCYHSLEKSWWSVAREIAQEYLQRFGESIEGTNPVSYCMQEYRRVIRNGKST